MGTEQRLKRQDDEKAQSDHKTESLGWISGAKQPATGGFGEGGKHKVRNVLNVWSPALRDVRNNSRKLKNSQAL